MKRSEMASKLSEFIEMIRREDAINQSATGSIIPAEAYSYGILDKLEVEGMKPPETKEPCETFVLYNGKHVKCEDSFVFTYKWDEE